MSAIDSPEGTASTEDVLEQVRRDGSSVLRRITAAESRRVERLLRRMLGPRPDLEDLVQSVFVEMCQSIHRYRGEGSISAFLTGITVRVARRAMRRPAWFARRGKMPTEVVAASPGPEHHVLEREQLRRFQALLEKLSAPKRIAFVLWAVEGMDVTTIAQTMNASVSATRGRILHAQRELRACIGSDPQLADLARRFDSDG